MRYIALVLLTLLLAVPAKGYSQNISNGIITKIKTLAAKRFPKSYSTQVFVIEQETNAFNKINAYKKQSKSKSILNKILTDAARRFPESYSTQIFVVEQEIDAFNKINE